MTPAELKQRTKTFAVRILKLVDALPTRTSGRVVGGQIARSGCSVAANYRAACRGRSKAEFIAKLGIAEEEADETLLWLEIIEEAGLQPARRLAELRREADELTAIFSASRITARNRPSKIENRQSP
jgi:four helix bundle protein